MYEESEESQFEEIWEDQDDRQFDDVLTESPPPLPDDAVNVNKPDPVLLWLMGFLLILQAKII